MKRYFCDCCEVEVKQLNSISVPCHLYSMKSRGGYTDTEGNSVSGRMDVIELCNRCYNRAYTALISSIAKGDV